MCLFHRVDYIVGNDIFGILLLQMLSPLVKDVFLPCSLLVQIFHRFLLILFLDKKPGWSHLV